MKAYVVRNKNGAIVRGWLLSRAATMGRLTHGLKLDLAAAEVEEISIEAAFKGAADTSASRVNRETGASQRPRSGASAREWNERTGDQHQAA